VEDIVTLKSGLGSLKVIGNATIWKLRPVSCWIP